MISQPIVEEMNMKMQKLAGDSRYYDKRKSLVVQNLRSIGDVYSFWIENPELRKELLIDKSKHKSIKKQAVKGIQDVNNGWYFLSEIGKNGKFLENFDETALKRLNGLVFHDAEMPRDFRKKDVTLNILGYTPSSWEKVPYRVNQALEEIREMYLKNPVEAAIKAHLSIGAIQPFMDGNKRCARLVQDRILLDAGMPPAMIAAGEGKFYHDLFSKTLIAYRDKYEEGQRQFYDYCASKINNGLDEILGDLFEEPHLVNHH